MKKPFLTILLFVSSYQMFRPPTNYMWTTIGYIELAVGCIYLAIGRIQELSDED